MLMPVPKAGRGPATDFTVLTSLVGGLLIWLVLASYALGRSQRLAVQQLQEDVATYVAGELSGAVTATEAQQALVQQAPLARLATRLGVAVGEPANDTRRTLATVPGGVGAVSAAIRIVQVTETPGMSMAPGRPALLQGFVVFALAATCGLGAMLLVRLQRQHEATTARTNFVRVVSHELRTPLAQILMFAETVRLGRTRTEGERVFALDVILQETRRLSRLVENVLRFTRLEHGGTTLRQEAIDVGAVVHETAAQFVPAGNGAGPRIHVRCMAPCDALGDRDALRQVLVNLFDNALKHGVPVHHPSASTAVEPTSGVRVDVRAVDREVEIQVEDDGPGVLSEDRERIWHAFERATTTNRGDTGTGLGLTIVRALVEAMDGAVRYDATAPTGARFVVTLPRHRDHGVVARPLVGHTS